MKVTQAYRLQENPDMDHWHPNPNISEGKDALVLTSDAPKMLQPMRFDFTPYWA